MTTSLAIFFSSFWRIEDKLRRLISFIQVAKPEASGYKSLVQVEICSTSGKQFEKRLSARDFLLDNDRL